LDRFKATLADTKFFDILVGYFHSSGFYQLCDSLELIEKTRILVGLGIDDETNRAITAYKAQTVLDFESHKSAKDQIQQTLIEEIENSEEADDKLEFGLKKFIEFLKTECSDSEKDCNPGANGNKLEIRAFPSRNLHAKVYIGRFAPDDRDYGFVITGSSNFSYSGLVANREFNVELRQRRDVEYALEQFEDLWRQSVDISEDFVNAVQKKTWLNDTITPYELYLKLIYEYLQEDINLQDETEFFLPDGFMSLQYQQQAVQQALKKLKEYNGVFLADVVGLGKTFIAAQLLQQVKGRILVICPPVLKSYWEESLHDFRVPARVESLGKLEKIMRFGSDRFDYVVVDEAHRFRNEATRSYADLLDICRGKKVILVTATPLNNTIDDIFAQLKLFQAPKNSTIPGIPNLERFFASLRGRFKGLTRTDPAYKEAIKTISRAIRERVLKHVMVRRTRSDVMTYFKKDTENQGLFFPEVQDPRRIVYKFEDRLETIFNQTIGLLQEFRYARYIPLLYYSGSKQLSEFERQQQRNIGGFMKGILIKRLESSFYAFRKSIRRFIESYERFIAMLAAGTVYISKDVDVYDLLDNDDVDILERYVDEERASKYASKDFRGDFLADLQYDLELLRKVEHLWQDVVQDPKLDAFRAQLTRDAVLKNRLVVFTESKETGEYLFEQINRDYPGRVIFFSSQGGRTGNPAVTHNPALARDLIKSSFDPNQKEYNDRLRILISTDVLSEGINLHRGNVLINYDLPWNPTRVLQRAGRINRLGTQFPQIYIYNFFPTTQADAHLGLEANITNKIQMFHNILGEDARYLSDGEEIGSQELFDTLNRRQAYTGEQEEGDSELKYLELLRALRDEQPDLFEKIKRLPKKARSGRCVEGLSTDQLVSFFRIGPLKKFYCHQSGASSEITFFEAVNLLECAPKTPREQIPSDYYHWLEINKQRFAQDAVQDEDSPAAGSGGQSNVAYIEKRLKDKLIRNCQKFTDADEEFLENVRKMIAQGIMAKRTAQTIKKEFEKTLDPLELLAILRKHIRSVDDGNTQPRKFGSARREIILSGYQIAAGGK
jgi:ERCC4-related helicase